MKTPIKNEPIMQKKPVIVTKAENLESIVSLIHDEFFILDEVSYSEGEGVVNIPYRRIFHGHPSRIVRNWLISRTYEVDVIRSVLVIRNVKEYTFNDKYHLGTYSFNTLSYDDGVLLIKCCEGIDLQMLVSELEIESQDLEVKGKARVSRGLFWSSNTSKVYD